MTDIDHTPLLPEPPLRQPPGSDDGKGGFSAWTRSLLMVGLPPAGMALGSWVASAIAAGALDHFNWKQGVCGWRLFSA